MICISSNPEQTIQALPYCKAYPGRISTTTGMHPHQAKHFKQKTLIDIEGLVGNDHVVAIGECGLDYDRDFSPRSDQRRCFEAQVALASKLNLPLLLHQREAHQDFVDTLDCFQLPGGGVVHCFTDSRDALGAYLDRGLHIGITGWICDERRGLALQEMVREIPLDRLLLETDAPYLVPRDMRPKPKKGRNEPAFLKHIASRIAHFMACPSKTVIEASAANARRLFGLPRHPDSLQ